MHRPFGCARTSFCVFLFHYLKIVLEILLFFSIEVTTTPTDTFSYCVYSKYTILKRKVNKILLEYLKKNVPRLYIIDINNTPIRSELAILYFDQRCD